MYIAVEVFFSLEYKRWEKGYFAEFKIVYTQFCIDVFCSWEKKKNTKKNMGVSVWYDMWYE
jgi:hypothetical protein